MRLYRIGDKVVSEDKLHDAITAILEARESGVTQEDVARAQGVQRSFVSFLETLGEVRRGDKVALVGFPIANAEEVKDLAETHSLDFVLVLSQDERESIESGDATRVFNQLLETIAALKDYDTLVLIASDWRIRDHGADPRHGGHRHAARGLAASRRRAGRSRRSSTES